MGITEAKTTPMMVQWKSLKEQSKEALLLFRLGDFYEAFYEDATELANTVQVTLTQRQGIPMAGIPAQSLETYLDKLVKAGKLIALAEQVEDPKEAQGIVKREIVQMISSGTTQNTDEAAHNFFASLFQSSSLYGLALIDLSTGSLFVAEMETEEALFDELYRRAPKEILVSDKFRSTELFANLKEKYPFRLNIGPRYLFDYEMALEKLTHHFKVHSVDSLGLRDLVGAVSATGALLSYLSDERHLSLAHIKTLEKIPLNETLSVDRTTYHHLELDRLFIHLNKTATPMGNRLLKRFLTHPLRSLEAIKQRQETIKVLLRPLNLSGHLRKIRDLDRLATRITQETATPRDLIALKISLAEIPLIQKILTPVLHLPLGDTTFLYECLANTLADEVPSKLSDGGVIRRGFSSELDLLRELKTDSETYLLNYQETLKKELDIKTLKVTYNKAYGYFIEVSRGQAGKMPATFEKRQTLINSERFISPELKSFEDKILSADEQMVLLEKELFLSLLKTLNEHLPLIQSISKQVAHLDAHLALAQVAHLYNYICPELDTSTSLSIIGGRHPLLDTPEFVPNDLVLDETQKLIILTGPNMAGKSTYIKQVAILTIMAQMGSFIPATSAQIGLVDQVFSRVGASDNLSKGQSTFMVEMIETANILRNATKHSLVILDEIGRGTSTYDGIAIAWAVAEALQGVKTLFATHYFELTSLKETLPQVENYTVVIEESPSGIAFLHKIKRGSADKSYGIHVAKLAGLPLHVIERAKERLVELEQDKGIAPKPQAPSFFREDPRIEKLNQLKLDEMSPKEALLFLYNLSCEFIPYP
ncbi:MAG: DNA mismatch repair protein MutS [Simkaniaceae bacterium]|nr:DNA mismatch repair protein MutS [Simkaniaceae bacterium]